jgi:hypothetical protein
VEYQYFVVDPGWSEERWIASAQVVPGNAAIVHHAIVFVRPPDGSDFRGVGWLAAYVPGQRTVRLPAGRARKVPAGSRLVFQMHYTPNGKVQQDLTRIGIQFADRQEVTHEVFTVMGIDQDFEIPPHAENHLVAGEVRSFPRQGELLSVSPHMHLRGKSFRLSAERAGANEVLLDVPRYDFNWQHEYTFAEPMALASIDHLRFQVAFDNSPQNPVNPDPSQHVTWGDQTWEEMAVAFFNVSEPLQSDTPSVVEAPSSTSASDASESAESVEQRKRVGRFVTEFFQKLDKDHDGLVQYDETPLAVQRFSFVEFDRDGNQLLTREEVEQVARERLNR